MHKLGTLQQQRTIIQFAFTPEVTPMRSILKSQVGQPTKLICNSNSVPSGIGSFNRERDKRDRFRHPYRLLIVEMHHIKQPGSIVNPDEYTLIYEEKTP